VLTAAGIDTTAPGILLADTIAKPYTAALFAAIGLHRVWDRAAAEVIAE
jgi:catalase